MEFIKMILPSYVVSAIIFYFIFKKIIGEKLRNIKFYKKILLFVINIIFYSVLVEIIDGYNALKGDVPIFKGIFLGIIV
ncbi:MAG TPA: hypothetical protein DG753_03295, partial [Clostridium sp.]|nr:hypothetical protein [Clostridium sp.]